MRIGRMRHQVDLLRPTPRRSATGQQVETWEKYARCWMGVEPLTTRVRLQVDQLLADITHRGVARYHPDVRVGHRVRLGTRVLEVKGVINRDERNRELELMLIETETP